TSIVLRREDRVREMPLEDFYIAYQKSALEAGEFVQGIRVPYPGTAQRFRTYKLAKRFDQDISAVCAAFAVELDGDVVRSARVAFGGMAATPKRGAAIEAALNGQPWNEASVRAAMAALPTD
ncbi:FAD binding domain-containing protein, partial [Pandoraea sputorum]